MWSRGASVDWDRAPERTVSRHTARLLAAAEAATCCNDHLSVSEAILRRRQPTFRTIPRAYSLPLFSTLPAIFQVIRLPQQGRPLSGHIFEWVRLRFRATRFGGMWQLIRSAILHAELAPSIKLGSRNNKMKYPLKNLHLNARFLRKFVCVL